MNVKTEETVKLKIEDGAKDHIVKDTQNESKKQVDINYNVTEVDVETDEVCLIKLKDKLTKTVSNNYYNHNN